MKRRDGMHSLIRISNVTICKPPQPLCFDADENPLGCLPSWGFIGSLGCSLPAADSGRIMHGVVTTDTFTGSQN
jgi:hypothetical protein